MAGPQSWAALDEPLDPEVVARAADWHREHETHQAPTAEEPPPKPASEIKAPPPVPSVRGGYGQTVVTYAILEETLRDLVKRERASLGARVEPYLNAVVDAMKETFASARTKTTWRFEEAERRIAELEARIARMEGQGHDG